MSKYAMYDLEDDDKYSNKDDHDRYERDQEIYFYAHVPRNPLGCAPVGFFCAEHEEMLITPERCLSGVFSTFVNED